MKDRNPEGDVSAFWFRRDLRLTDNRGLSEALRAGLKSGRSVLPVFIFDPDILDRLEDKDDARVDFIYQTLQQIDGELREMGSGLLVEYGRPEDVWPQLLQKHKIKSVYFNRDYEPAARARDQKVNTLLAAKAVAVLDFKDHLIFEKSEVVKDDGLPYTVFTPYSRKWKTLLTPAAVAPCDCDLQGLLQWSAPALRPLESLGFRPSGQSFPARKIRLEILRHYADRRNTPSIEGTSRLGLHLRFGTVSPRKLVALAREKSETWLNELIWREFFSQILWHFPYVAGAAFRPAFERIQFRQDHEQFQAWCEGRTGFAIVDAGMCELNQTGFMHNRVRMIAASVLVKHLLIDWRWGERYFARHLLDFDLASNNGNWQWVAGTGCDAAPYFRVFNPELQTEKFDPDGTYIRKWLRGRAPLEPLIDHKTARVRALQAYSVVKAPL